MTLKDEIAAYAKKTHDDVWERREGRKVPESEDVRAGTDAVTLDGTVLYADLADSTGMVKSKKDWFAAEVYKNYLYAACRIIKANEGVVTAFDGDRVMGVFLGDSKNTNACKTALQLNWVVKNVLQPAKDAKYTQDTFTYKQRVGIDASPLFIAKTGIRNSNDLVWVGHAANNAAKMAALHSNYPSYITESIFNRIHKSAKTSKDGRDMWQPLGSSALGFPIYGSTFWWGI